MLAKFNLLMAMLAVVSFLLSLWTVPAALVAVAMLAIKTLWIKICLWVVAALWLLLLRPWTVFKQPKWSQFLADMRRGINGLFS